METVLKSTVLGSDVFSSLSFSGKSTREIPELSPSGQIGTADSLPVGVTQLGCCFFFFLHHIAVHDSGDHLQTT